MKIVTYEEFSQKDTEMKGFLEKLNSKLAKQVNELYAKSDDENVTPRDIAERLHDITQKDDLFPPTVIRRAEDCAYLRSAMLNKETMIDVRIEPLINALLEVKEWELRQFDLIIQPQLPF